MTATLALNSKWRLLLEYVYLISGAAIIAISFNVFLNPNEIASGGVAGISIILRSYFNWEPAVVQWAINIPLFVAGLLLLGRRFGVKTAVGSVILPLFVLLTREWETPTHDPLLASLYGGICIGIGLGIVFRGRASTGGLDLAAQIIHKYTGLSLGLAIAILDGLVILTAGFVFSPEKALYALIGLFVTSKTIDVVQMGLSYSKVAFIISDLQTDIQKVVLEDLDRGLTRLTAHGGYTGTKREVLMVVVSQTEVSKLKALVKSVDPHAFIILSDTTEVLGEGFKAVH
ncbi:YitT family protein [Marinicrinis sediminis]|uniref:YitT family protein n=1 Tax=Marinicrinis sediminis TaxID=1652465 RepID=A0ABW5RB16_9BACL